MCDHLDDDMAPDHVNPAHIHVDGTAVDRAEWYVGRPDDDFDAAAMERAMIEARRSAYSELTDLGAA